MKDLYSDFRATSVIKPQSVSNDATGNGTGTDLLGYEGALMICSVGAVGALFDASNFYTIKFLESANNVVFSAIADTDLVGGNNTVVIDANAEANSVHQRGYIGTARYVTVTIDCTGTLTAPATALVIKGFPIHAPIA
jgi:hypothetical protein